MANYILTNKAVDDLGQIWKYTFDKWSEHQADIYYYMLLDNFKKVASNPDLGKYYSEIAENLFGFKSGKHIIFYRRFKDADIEIIRILHEQMDLKNRIKDI